MKKLGIAFALMGLMACGEGYSNGDRAGTVTKFSSKGYFCKTWEGELNMGGMREESDGKHTSIVANIWEFSVTDPNVVAQVKEAMATGQHVVLTYDQWMIAPLCTSMSGYVVTEVK